MQRSSGSLPQPRFALKGPQNTEKCSALFVEGMLGCTRCNLLAPLLGKCPSAGLTPPRLLLSSALGHRVPAPSSSKPRACGLPGLLSHLVTSRHISLAPLHRRLYEVLRFPQQMLGEHFRTVNSGIKREPRDGLVQPCVLQTRDPELWSVVCFGKFLSPVI